MIIKKSIKIALGAGYGKGQGLRSLVHKVARHKTVATQNKNIDSEIQRQTQNVS